MRTPADRHGDVFGVVQLHDGPLLDDVPHNKPVAGAGADEQVQVVGTPADGCDRLLVLRHNRLELKLVVLPVILKVDVRVTSYRILNMNKLDGMA